MNKSPARKELIMPNFCSNCGRPLKNGVTFCGNCGTVIYNAPRQQPSQPQYPTQPVQPVQQPVMPQYNPQPQQYNPQAQYNAPAQPYAAPVYPQPAQPMPEFIGEHTLTGGGELGIDLGVPKAAIPEKIGSLTNPVGALFSGLGSALAGPFVMFAHIKALLFTAAISALWIWLGSLAENGETNIWTDILSVLTYAKGGTYGTTVNVIGEFFGKALVAGGLCTLLYGGIPKIGKGLKSLFTTKGFNIGSLLIGLSVAMACGKFFAGEQMGYDGIMVGICGAMCALESISQKNGFIFTLAASFSRRTQGSGKTLHFPQYKSLLAGGALGFLISSGLGAAHIYLTDMMYWVFLGVFAVGVIITLCTKGKAGAAA